MAVDFRKMLRCGLPLAELADWERDLLTMLAEPVPESDLSLRRGGPLHCQFPPSLVQGLGDNDLCVLADAFAYKVRVKASVAALRATLRAAAAV